MYYMNNEIGKKSQNPEINSGILHSWSAQFQNCYSNHQDNFCVLQKSFGFFTIHSHQGPNLQSRQEKVTYK